ncbi:MAG TPA: argininosuccinate lyase [Candidatus Limnocylindrales bacterium]|nr:argininosuccinate lyase [Candidatus Limnocylindrales bacterium]
MTLWGGRFTGTADEALRRLNDSLPFDRRMALQDIAGSMAYARAIHQAGVLSDGDLGQILDGLERVHAEYAGGAMIFAPGDEDIHTAVERRLTELIGPAGAKLHTGRSRNDQVATDMRLWLLDTLAGLDAQLRALQAAFVAQGERHAGTLMPGFTHMQAAQPITAGHWLMSFFWMLARDRDRLRDCARRASVSPLGSGALAGTPFAVDRAALAAELGFADTSQNSLDAVSDRDFVAEALFVLALIGVHLSRFGEDIVLFSSPGFGFVTLDDRFSTGSSLMPQKRNPDPLELARGKAGRLIGNLTGLLATLKGLPTGYNKDLQEDKEALFDAVDTLELLLPVMTAVVGTLALNVDTMRAALSADMLATDLADYLVRKGMPFREAHGVAGRAVARAGELGLPLGELPLAELRVLSPLFADDVVAVFDFEESVRRRAAIGGTAPEAVRAQIEAARAWLDGLLPLR